MRIKERRRFYYFILGSLVLIQILAIIFVRDYLRLLSPDGL